MWKPCASLPPLARETLDATLHSFVFELTGASEEVERFIKLMTAVGLKEVARTGIAAIGRGAEGL